MKLVEIRCKNCKAVLNVNKNDKIIKCSYCNTEFLLDDVKKIKIIDMEQNGYEFEKGRIRAQKEEKEKEDNKEPIKKSSEIIRAIKFLFFSISAGVIEMGSFAILNEYSGLPYWPCYLIALVLSVIWNFTLNRKFTFQSSNNVPVAMFKVFCYYLVFTPLSTLLGNYLTSIGWNEYLVTGINMVLNFITEFLFQRFYVFKDSIDTKVVKIK